MMKAEAVGRGREERRTGVTLGPSQTFLTQPRLPQQQPSQVPLAGSQDKMPATHGMPLSHILAQGSLPDLTRAQHSPKSYLALALNSSFPRHRRPLSFTGAVCIAPLAPSSLPSKCLSACYLDNKEHEAGGRGRGKEEGSSARAVSLHLHSPASTNHYIQRPYFPRTLQSFHLYTEQ